MDRQTASSQRMAFSRPLPVRCPRVASSAHRPPMRSMPLARHTSSRFCVVRRWDSMLEPLVRDRRVPDVSTCRPACPTPPQDSPQMRHPSYAPDVQSPCPALPVALWIAPCVLLDTCVPQPTQGVRIILALLVKRIELPTTCVISIREAPAPARHRRSLCAIPPARCSIAPHHRN